MKSVADLSAFEVRAIMKKITRQEFEYADERPEDCIFALRDFNIKFIESLCIEWAVKNAHGILVMTEPITRLSFWRIPEDVRLPDMAKDEATRDAFEQYKQFIQGVYQGVYVYNTKFRTNIKLDENEIEPRLFLFLSNSQSAEIFIASVAALEQLLPRLEQSA